jgi:regulation of enolase protein 1 (concanavalin A-like superfamily)
VVTLVIIPGLPFPLMPDGSPACRHEVTDSALILTSAPKTDLFIDPAAPDGRRPDAGRLSGVPPEGDFTFSARVTVEFASQFDAGVLLVYAGDQHWAKLCFEFSPQSRPTAVTVVTRYASDDCNSFEIAGRALWLRVTRTGPAWAFHASTDGAWWRLLRYFSFYGGPPRGQVAVGFLAQSPTGQGCTAIFDHIRFAPGAPADLRDGS